MKINIKRMFKGENYTIGYLYINDVFFCNTLEDPVRPVKIKNETAIPAGTYTVILNHSNRFNRIMPLLLNVPNFTGIRIHSGNTAKDTSGCILVGNNSKKGMVTQSRIVYNKLFNKLQQVKDKVEITIS